MRRCGCVAAHDHVGGAIDVDGIAVLASAAGARAGVIDAVVGDQAAVVPLDALTDTDAAIAGFGMTLAAMMRPRLSLQNSALSAAPVIVQCRHVAVAVLERDAVAAGAGDFAIGDADGLHVIEVHQAAIVRQRLAAAVEREAAERDGVGVLGG